LRAMAGAPGLEVTFGGDRPLLSGDQARLPEPTKKPTARDISISRGIGDSMALRLACHDPKVHSHLAPVGRKARAVFDAVEQARVEAIGARSMAGVAANLNEMCVTIARRQLYQTQTVARRLQSHRFAINCYRCTQI